LQEIHDKNEPRFVKQLHTHTYLITSSVNASGYIVLPDSTISELKRAWNEAIEAAFGYYSHVFLE
jgi:hypothetical protein